MLRIAIPNKGSLSEPACRMLKEAGYRQRRSGRELVLADEANGVEFFFLRPRDIAIYVGTGTVDAGITGRDLLKDSDTEAVEYRALGFARSTFRFAGPAGQNLTTDSLAGTRIATSYDRLVRTYLEEHGLSAEVVHLDGAVESSVQLGIADVVADVVETGSTLRAAGLEVFGEPLLESEAVLIHRAGVTPTRGFDILTQRLHGVMVARQYVLMDYDVPTDRLDEAIALTPGYESPTISPLHDRSWMAVRALVEKSRMNDVMDELHEVGARAILITPIIACRM